MRKFTLAFLLTLTQIVGCKKVTEIPSKIVTLDSYAYDGLKGFYFETGTIIRYPNSNNIQPDFSVLAQIDQTGIVGPFLSNPDLIPIFSLTDSFSDKELADKYFDNYTVASATNFDQHALNLQPYQVWTIKTNQGKLAKLLVLDTQKGLITDPFAKVTFRWDYIE